MAMVHRQLGGQSLGLGRLEPHRPGLQKRMAMVPLLGNRQLGS